MSSLKAADGGVREGAGRESPAVDATAWAAPPVSGLGRFVAIARWLPQYGGGKWLVADLLAGMTVWGLIVPEAMGYASIAGMPLQAGLYTLVGTLIVYTIFGTSRQLVIAATAAAASITASVVAGVQPSAAEYPQMVGVVVLAVGALFLLAGLLRLGFIAAFIPRPVMAGFVFGLGLFIMAKQAYKVFGLPKPSGSTIQLIISDIGNLDRISWTTTALGIGAIGALLLFERFLRKLPGALIVLFAGIGLSALLDLKNHGVDIVGKVPSGLPSFGLPDISASGAATLVAGAVGVMLVIMSESLGGADTFAQKHHYRVDTNQELIAQGFTNLASGFLGGLANGGSMSSSSVNDNAGARTPLSLAVAWVLVILTLLFMTPLFTNLPEAVLGAIVIVAVKGLIKTGEFKRFWEVRRIEFWLGIITLAVVILWDVLPAMVLGVVLAILLMTYRASRSSVAVLARKPGTSDAWRDLANHEDWESVPEILVLRPNAQLFYANAETTVDDAKRLIGKSKPRGVVLDIEATRTLDITGGEFLARLVQNVKDAGILLAFAGADQAVIAFLRRAGLLETIGRDNLYPTVAEAVGALQSPPTGDAAVVRGLRREGGMPDHNS